jgi:hypothetical protein
MLMPRQDQPDGGAWRQRRMDEMPLTSHAHHHDEVTNETNEGVSQQGFFRFIRSFVLTSESRHTTISPASGSPGTAPTPAGSTVKGRGQRPSPLERMAVKTRKDGMKERGSHTPLMMLIGEEGLTINWLQVFRRADAGLLGSERRQPHQTRAVR